MNKNQLNCLRALLKSKTTVDNAWLSDKIEEINKFESPVVWGRNERVYDMRAIVEIMDDEIREDLHGQGIDSDQEFLRAYQERHLIAYNQDFDPTALNF
jgi:hypothetical protein